MPTEYRSSIDRDIDRVSIEYRSSLGRVSSDISTDISADVSTDVSAEAPHQKNLQEENMKGLVGRIRIFLVQVIQDQRSVPGLVYIALYLVL